MLVAWPRRLRACFSGAMLCFCERDYPSGLPLPCSAFPSPELRLPEQPLTFPLGMVAKGHAEERDGSAGCQSNARVVRALRKCRFPGLPSRRRAVGFPACGKGALPSR